MAYATKEDLLKFIDNDSHIHLTVEHKQGKKNPRHTFRVVVKGMLVSAVLIATLGLASSDSIYAEAAKQARADFVQPVSYVQVVEIAEEAELIARLDVAANFVKTVYESNLINASALQQLGRRLAEIETELNKGSIVPSVSLVEAVEKANYILEGVDLNKEGVLITEGVDEAYKETRFILSNVKIKLGIAERQRIADRGSLGIDFNQTAKNYNVKVFIDSADNELDFANLKDDHGNTLGAPFVCKVTDRTFIPYRIMAERMGAEVDWDAAMKQVIAVSKEGNKVVMTIGKSQFLVDGTNKTMDVEPFILRTEGRTYIPARYLTEGLGYNIDFGWVGGNQIIYIVSFTKGQSAEQQEAIKKQIEAKLEQKEQAGLTRTSLTAAEQKRLQGYEFPSGTGGEFAGFEEVYNNRPGARTVGVPELVKDWNTRFFTDADKNFVYGDKTIYITSGGAAAIRGIMQISYKGKNDYGLTPGKVYEVDLQFVGGYYDYKGVPTYRVNNEGRFLSEFREVK